MVSKYNCVVLMFPIHTECPFGHCYFVSEVLQIFICDLFIINVLLITFSVENQCSNTIVHSVDLESEVETINSNLAIEQLDSK